MNELDLGSVARCLVVADFVTAVFPPHRNGYTALDWGGGDGLLTRLLRERDVNCVWQDPFAKPRFVGDAIYEPNSRVDVTVVSEVFLHLTDPVSALRSLLS
ncbi:MAG: methyltransferase domain-containing protein, partial [Acidimicrobiaceae bacterium]